MTWLNEWEIGNLLETFDPEETPNLYRGAQILGRLVSWTNSHSDGWPYWTKPSRAASSLQDLLHEADRFDPVDVTEADLRKALSPVKAFLTRQHVDHAPILEGS